MIGLCIRYFNKNYGGMLQCFALTRFLEKNNIQYEMIRYQKKKNIVLLFKSIPRLFNGVLMNDKKEMLKKKIGRLLHKEFRNNDNIRSKCFEKFCDDSFTKLSPIYHGYYSLRKNSSKYSVVVSGSDQLWSPAGLPTNFYNLQFCEKGVKRISYASSFGVSFIPWYQKRRTSDYLRKMNQISVREEKAAEIIHNLIGEEVQVVLDPVFLLEQNEWNDYIEEKDIVHDNYIFAYFLGKNESYRRDVMKFAKEKKMKVVTLKHVDQYVKSDVTFGDEELYNVGPADFLNLIRHARYVFTDSFHGSAFSILNHKKFLCFKRYGDTSKVSKNSRISSLMNLFSIDCVFDGDIKKVEQPIDYDKVDDILNSKRNESISFLLEAIDCEQK